MIALASYLPAFVGGVLIGTSAAMLLLLLGRIAGISGIVANLLSPIGADWMWRAAFVLGLIAGPLLFTALTGAPRMNTSSPTSPPTHRTTPPRWTSRLDTAKSWSTAEAVPCRF